MSSQKGNVSRTRGQRYQNSTAFRNNKYGTSVQVKKANAIVHDGVCKHCKELLEWKVKYMKFKPLTQPRKCVKCLQKTVKDAYHIICKTCALQLELCAKCGKKEDIIIPLCTQKADEEGEEGVAQETCLKKRGLSRKAGARDNDFDDDDDDDDDDLDHDDDFGAGSDLDSSDGDTRSRDKPSKDPLPEVSTLQIQDTSKLG
ncbi:hypothetical protein SKAU_G00014930 [Synaphobranchus kaupii]|uniref:Uncharacterized protein n=1 Tax=Synaphobranchus kaupii TaxID=118154 RepID=A0A9Q1JDB5_SYNKA|nr:hypothetical protein SKAU_G00014930 [Synaphobranchus kaupii]